MSAELEYNLPTVNEFYPTTVQGSATFLFFSEALDDIFRLIDKHQRRCEQLSLQRDSATSDEAYLHSDFAFETSHEIIELHLGNALVLCQYFISKIRQEHGSFLELKFGKGDQKKKLFPGSTGMHKVNLGNEIISNIEVILHLANYFKHLDEWDANWLRSPPSPAGQNQKAAANMTQIALRKIAMELAPSNHHYTNPSLRDAVSIIGIKTLTISSLNTLKTQIQIWADAVYAEIQSTATAAAS